MRRRKLAAPTYILPGSIYLYYNILEAFKGKRVAEGVSFRVFMPLAPSLGLGKIR